MNDILKEKISLLPDLPGCYIYYDRSGTVIYVGKAKKLKRRVSSYFNRVHDSVKTNVLVRNIADMRYVVVGSEDDALHLENSLIKEYQPRYNILLKDDKSYPWICVTNELFPRVFMTRNVTRKGGRFYGPYADVSVARTMLELLKELFPLRTCRYPLTRESVEQGRVKVCLDYHIHNCRGCCEGLVSPEEYGEYIVQVKQILSGDTQQISDHLLTEMTKLAENLKFEEAHELKRKYQTVEKYKAKSVIVSSTVSDIDVFSYEPGDDCAYVNYMHVRHGSVVQCVTFEYRKRLDETPEEMLSYAIAEAKAQFGVLAREIVVPFVPDFESEHYTFVVPQRGDKKKLLEISLQNARQYKHDRILNAEKLNPEQRTIRLLTRMQKDFRLKELPRHIECFDNSNIQGTNPVASCVVFKNGKPSKRDYRHFNIKTVEGPDDFASMREVVGRRYSRLIEEGQPLPQLVVVDGGKGQLSSAVEVFDELGIRGKVALVGIAKRLEEIYFPGDSVPLYIDKNSESLRVIQQLRDEAHRFGITHHRNRRSRGQTVSALDSIRGVGEKTRTALLTHFKSLKRLREADEQTVAAVIGPAKAKIVCEALRAEKSDG